ncbi:hypothetical protein [Enterovirga rhinocerotis]|nr:hypothetical protein [Enterovirga rhinocerotis]
MQCARGFGALYSMRDEPGDAPIPDRFEPQTAYHDERLAAARVRLIQLLAMSSEEVRAAAEESQRESDKSLNEYKARRLLHRERYEAMLVRVRDWAPPSSEHEPLKEFMIEQLESSINFDCSTGPWSEQPAPLSPEDWFDDELQKASREVGYHTRERAKEIERTESRNKWLADLRASLAEIEEVS